MPRQLPFAAPSGIGSVGWKADSLHRTFARAKLDGIPYHATPCRASRPRAFRITGLGENAVGSSLRAIGESLAMRRLGIAVAAMLTLSAHPAHADECGKPADLHDGWEVAAPEAQGLDPAVLCSVGPRFEAWHEANAHADLVVRHRVLVYEHYFSGEDETVTRGPLGRVAHDTDKLHDLRSITKSVTSLLVG